MDHPLPWAGRLSSLRRRAAALGRGLAPWLASSVLHKTLGALLLALAMSSVATVIMQREMTKGALRKQAERVARSHLDVLHDAFVRGEAGLLSSIRSSTDELKLRGLVEPGRLNELHATLGSTQRNLNLDFLQLIDVQGRLVAWAGSIRLQPLDPATAGVDPFDSQVVLLGTHEGRYVQAAFVPIGAGPEFHLVGGREFGDALALQLRGAAGYDVLLVADGALSGSTLSRSARRPPLADPSGGLPRSPGVVRLDGGERLVLYETVGLPGGGSQVAGALGIAFALPEPVAALGAALGRTRIAGAAILFLVAVPLSWFLVSALTRPLVGLTGTAGRIAKGDLDATFSARSRDEIGKLAGALERMRVELRSQLEVIGRQATALRGTSKRIAAAQDGERHRLARDLHDGIQQQLVVLRMGLGLAKEQVKADPGLAAELCDQLGDELDRAIERLREVSHDIYPSILVDRGLSAAVRSYAGRLPLSTRFVSDPDPLPRLDAEIESSAYFLVAEAATNALKHARASQLRITLRLADGWLNVNIADDGQGFREERAPDGRGLVNMEDRVRSFGGELSYRSEPGRGVEVRASIPVGASRIRAAWAGGE